MSSNQPGDDDDDEPREYSSPACYLHEFEQQPAPRVDSPPKVIAASPATTEPASQPDCKPSPTAVNPKD